MPSTEVYCTAAEIRAQINGTSPSDDATLTAIASAVSRFFDGFLGHKEGLVALSTATAKEYSTFGQSFCWIDECIEVTAVATKDAVTDTTYPQSLTVGTHIRGFRGDPKHRPNFNDVPYHGLILLPNAPVSRFLDSRFSQMQGFPTYGDDSTGEVNMPTLQVTAKWGYALTLSPIIKQAAIMHSTRVYKRIQGGMADALLSGDFGQSRFISKLDKDVQVLLEMSGLKRPKWAR